MHTFRSSLRKKIWLQIPYHSGQTAGHEARPVPETHTAQCQLRVHEPPDGVARIHGVFWHIHYVSCIS